MRVGIMGGTLDPIHNGHIDSAVFVKDYLDLDSVMLLPVGDPPHKLPLIHKSDRYHMVKLAAQAHEGLFPCGIEIHRDRTTFTVDTLRELTEKNPNTEWHYIIGADTLDVLDSWRSFSEVARMCIFAVIGRGMEDASVSRMEFLQNEYGARFETIPFNGPDISSTAIREKVAHGESISGLVPDDIAAYIRERGLYLCSMTEEHIIETLRASLKPGRFTHTLGVAETAKRLAPRFNVDPYKAYLAGLLHDCAKYMPIDQMRETVTANIADVDSDELELVSLLHAPAGAVMARNVFGVKDPEILSAIRKHTLGGANMTPLDALIYTADFIEPNRPDFKGLSKVRDLAEKDIYAAMKLSTELTRDYVKKQGKKMHPRMYEILNNY